jgi:hypothetical protein
LSRAAGLKGDDQECSAIFLLTGPGLSSPCPHAPGYATDSIPRDNYLHHEESFKLNSWDLEIPLPWANLDVAGEGFTATCTEEEAGKLVKDFVESATRVIEMILVDMLEI